MHAGWKTDRLHICSYSCTTLPWPDTRRGTRRNTKDQTQDETGAELLIVVVVAVVAVGGKKFSNSIYHNSRSTALRLLLVHNIYNEHIEPDHDLVREELEAAAEQYHAMRKEVQTTCTEHKVGVL